MNSTKRNFILFLTFFKCFIALNGQYLAQDSSSKSFDQNDINLDILDHLISNYPLLSENDLINTNLNHLGVEENPHQIESDIPLQNNHLHNEESEHKPNVNSETMPEYDYETLINVKPHEVVSYVYQNHQVDDLTHRTELVPKSLTTVPESPQAAINTTISSSTATLLNTTETKTTTKLFDFKLSSSRSAMTSTILKTLFLNTTNATLASTTANENATLSRTNQSTLATTTNDNKKSAFIEDSSTFDDFYDRSLAMFNREKKSHGFNDYDTDMLKVRPAKGR